ncbi:MAG: 23S rRNA pseudouridine(955/2504/2580) synthase RluC [Methylococcales bacterium]|nr:23S rRNA pseudouridine(955/2504/2580) synthase RluC [Methylococcales bacterium]
MEQHQNQTKLEVQWVVITDAHAEQRLDNFLITRLKGVPKSLIYRIVRKGEVRVNKGRVDVKYRLVIGDTVRIPPVRVAEKAQENYVTQGLKKSLEQDILFEDDVLIILNKPAGYPVHGGSGVTSGVIESLRQLRPDAHFLELVHRLDKDTSGCLIIAKKRSALRKLHEIFRDDQVRKRYLALLSGRWDKKTLLVNVPLLKKPGEGGERVVVVSNLGKSAETVFKRIQAYQDTTLVSATPKTGRTHQIRVHAAWMGHPIISDERYGSFELNREFKKRGYKRLFLHAERLEFVHPVSGEIVAFNAPLPKSLQDLLANEKPL